MTALSHGLRLGTVKSIFATVDNVGETVDNHWVQRHSNAQPILPVAEPVEATDRMATPSPAESRRTHGAF